LLVETERDAVSYPDHILLTLACSVDVELHVGLLQSENVIATTNDLAQNAFDLLSG